MSKMKWSGVLRKKSGPVPRAPEAEATPDAGPLVDLPRFEDAELLRRIVPVDVDEPFGLYVLEATHPVSAVARNLERRVFADTFGDTEALLSAEYDHYDASSVFLVVVDHLRMVAAGTMRVIVPSPVGWKSLADARRHWGLDIDAAVDRTPGALTTDQVWDIATLAVAPEYRGSAARGLVSTALYQGLIMTSSRCGVDFFVATLDSVVLRVLQWQFSQLFAHFDGVPPAPHLGSASSSLVWCDVHGWRERLRLSDPHVYDLLFEGDGLTGAVRQPDWGVAAEVLRSRSVVGAR